MIDCVRELTNFDTIQVILFSFPIKKELKNHNGEA